MPFDVQSERLWVVVCPHENPITSFDVMQVARLNSQASLHSGYQRSKERCHGPNWGSLAHTEFDEPRPVALRRQGLEQELFGVASSENETVGKLES